MRCSRAARTHLTIVRTCSAYHVFCIGGGLARRLIEPSGSTSENRCHSSQRALGVAYESSQARGVQAMPSAQQQYDALECYVTRGWTISLRNDRWARACRCEQLSWLVTARPSLFKSNVKWSYCSACSPRHLLQQIVGSGMDRLLVDAPKGDSTFHKGARTEKSHAMKSFLSEALGCFLFGSGPSQRLVTNLWYTLTGIVTIGAFPVRYYAVLNAEEARAMMWIFRGYSRAQVSTRSSGRTI